VSSSRSIVGIDLGTTYSLVSVMRDGAPVVLPNALGEILTPSAVSVDGDTVLVGASARARATTHPAVTALAFKRDMGTDKQFELGRRRFSAQELSALMLSALKHDAESVLGHPVEEAVITVPAYFGDAQRQATRDAGAIAGLKVERIINEPTAAALAYGLHQRHRDQRAVVLDLGGGTFDVTVLEITDGIIEIQASSGDSRLGSEDFVDALAARVAAEIEKSHGANVRNFPVAWARVREACELAKRRLSSADGTGVALSQLSLGSRIIDFETTISREDAESAWQLLLERIRTPILRAFSDASLHLTQVDEVLLVGGSTRVPCVARLAAQLFGRLPVRSLPPDEAVAMGAAVQAGLKAGDEDLSDVVATDVAPFTIGIATVAQLGSQRVPGIFAPILHRGTVIPASRVNRFSTATDLQTEVKVEVFQGEHSICRDNQQLGQYKVQGLKPRPAGEEWFDIRFTYDLNGILEVETTVGSDGSKHALVIEKTPGRLSKAEVEAARQAMTRLKLHPRDALPNSAALARADALFVELTGDRREVLGVAIANLRAALETQDEPTIRAMREHLNALVTSLRG
jgi:molecular chaperone HscC